MNQREHYRQSFEAPEANVLVVDDNEMNLMVAEKLLRDTKVSVCTVTSGVSCLRETAHTAFDVIFMDHMMPEMDGIECLHEIRKQADGLNTSTPVVILTANAGNENRALYEREGFDGYLLKPITGKQLEAELLSHLSREKVTILQEEETAEADELQFEGRVKIPVMVTTDSVCDLPRELAEQYQIAVMPYHVYTEEGDFMEGVEVETEGLLSYIADGTRKARSEPPTVSEYEDFFADNLTKAQRVIHITMGKKSSGAFANASEAADAFDNVQVVDSGQLSSGLGLVVLRTAEFAAEGNRTAQMVLEYVEHARKRTSTTFLLDTTDFLARSGRLSPTVDRLCRALSIYPVLGMRDGKISLSSLKLGMREQRWKAYINSTLKNADSIDKRLLFITYAGMDYGALRQIEQEALRRVPFGQVIFYQASSAISANCGPGCFGLLFMRK